MKKSLLVKLLVLIVVVILSYCVFWFFKAGQSEKVISRFFNEASAFASMEEIKVSGFPAKQKFFIKNVKLNLNSGVFKNNKILISELEVEAGIFDNSYKIRPVGAVRVEDADLAGKIHEVKFSSEPTISMSIEKGMIASFSYSSGGFQIIDESGSSIFSSATSNVNLKTNADQQGKLSVSVNGSIDEVQSFGVADIYRNLFEKKIVEDIKNDLIKVEIPFGFNSAAFRKFFIDNEIQKKLSMQAVQSIVNNADQGGQQLNGGSTASAPVIQGSPSNVPSPTSNTPSVANSSTPNIPNPTQAQAAPPPSDEVPVAVAASAITNLELKSKISFDFAISLAGTDAALLSINQPQEAIAQGEQSLKINNISISNSKFEIAVNGSLTKTPDDSLPAGGLTVKITNFQNAIDNFESDFDQLIASAEKYVDIAKPKLELTDQAKSDQSVSGDNLSKTDQQPKIAEQKPAPTTDQNATLPVVQDQSSQVAYNMGDYYTQFFLQFSMRYKPVAIEIAAKNSVTKDNVAQFDIRREKNLEFLVNDTPIHDILGRL